MPTAITGQPLGPTEKRTIDDALAFGRLQWTAAWSAFSSQWSQPQLLKLAEGTLRTRSIHSSQIFGWKTGKLRDPSPKLLMAIGEVNLALAEAHGEAVTCRYKVPQALSKLWLDKRWLTDAQGAALGPCEVFQAFAGLIDLGVDADRHVPASAEAEVSTLLGKTLRLELAKQGVDWLGEIIQLKEQCPIVEQLLMGKTVNGAVISEHLPKLAALAGMDVEQLWLVGIQPAL